MRASWIGGAVRGELLLARRAGRERAAEIAARGTLPEALRSLLGSAYSDRLRVGATLAEAERSLAATTLWHLRVLAGWLPPGAAETMRALAGWFELANIEDKLVALGADFQPPPPFELGGLASAWRGVGRARDLPGVRNALGASAWGDPGEDTPQGILIALRTRWARRVAAELPEARPWVQGASALLLARELPLNDNSDRAALRELPGISASALAAQSIGELAARLPASASWALQPARTTQELWRAELGWWRVLERDAQEIRRRAHTGRARVLAAVALLAADARLLARALAVCARSIDPASIESIEALAGPRESASMPSLDGEALGAAA